jgi:tetratricopeptide (TPR) repeat protein
MLAAHPRHVGAIIFLTLAGATDASAEALNELLVEARSRERRGEWKQAASTWNRLVVLNPTIPSYWEKLGESSKRSGDFPNAVRAYRRALELGASHPGPTAYEIAVCYAQSGDNDNALQWLKKAVALGLRSLSWIADDEQLVSLRSHPEFQSLAMVADVTSMSRVEGWRHDLAFLASELKRRHYSPFRKVSKEEFEAAVASLHAKIPRLKDQEIEVGLMRLASMMGDGHTYLRPKDISARGLPVQLFQFKDRLFIIRASPEHRDLVAMRVERIWDHSAEDLLEKLDPIISQDNEMTPLMIGPELMTYPRLLFGLGLIPDADSVVITVVDTVGKSRQVVLKEQSVPPGREGWQSVRAERGPEVPLYLRHLDSNYWFEFLPERKLLFFQYNVVRDGPEPLTNFLDRLFQFVDEHEADRLVIDLRWNTGGTRLLNQQLVHRLIRNDKVNQPGKLFVIVGRYTFSAGMMLATEIEQNTKAIFVGEPTGSSPNFVGQDVTFVLPFSGMRGSLSDLYWQSSSATDFRVWIAPLLYTPPSFELFRSNRDPAMEAILGYTHAASAVAK